MNFISSIIPSIISLLFKQYRGKIKNTLAVQSWHDNKLWVRFTNICGESIVLKKVIFPYNCSIKDFYAGYMVNSNGEFNIYFNYVNFTNHNVLFIIKCSIGNDNDRYCLVCRKGNHWIVQ